MHKDKVYELMAENYNQNEIARMLGISRQRVNQILYPLKHKARTKLNYAVKKDKKVRINVCEHCDVWSLKLQGHHPDYKYPLDVVWLCQDCHVKLHNSFI